MIARSLVLPDRPKLPPAFDARVTRRPSTMEHDILSDVLRSVRRLRWNAVA
jgi:hypothetical protein